MAFDLGMAYQQTSRSLTSGCLCSQIGVKSGVGLMLAMSDASPARVGQELH